MSEPEVTTAAADPAVSVITAAPDGNVALAPVETAASPPPAHLDLTLLSDDVDGESAATDEAVVVDVPNTQEPPEPLLVEPIAVTVSETTPGASDDDADMVIAEAATPSFVSFETLESPSVAPEPLSVVAHAAGVLATVVEAAIEKEPAAVTSKEPHSDDILEQANGGNDLAAAEKQEAKATDDKEVKEDGSEAKEKVEQDAKGTPAADANEKKPKHTNVDEATAKVLES